MHIWLGQPVIQLLADYVCSSPEIYSIMFKDTDISFHIILNEWANCQPRNSFGFSISCQTPEVDKDVVHRIVSPWDILFFSRGLYWMIQFVCLDLDAYSSIIESLTERSPLALKRCINTRNCERRHLVNGVLRIFSRTKVRDKRRLYPEKLRRGIVRRGCQRL